MDNKLKLITLIRKRNGEILFIDAINFYLKNFKDNNNYYKNIASDKIKQVNYYNNLILDLCLEYGYQNEIVFMYKYIDVVESK